MGARPAAILAAALLAAACASPPEIYEEEGWTRIVRGSTGARVSRGALSAALREADYVILGEVHDNPVHHRLQWVVLQELSPRAIVMEQFDIEAQPAIDAALAAGSDADAVAAAGRLNMKGWSWPFYKPLVQVAIDNRVPLVAGNLPRSKAREVSTAGFSALPEAKSLALDAAWDAEREQALRQDIVESHCGQLTEASAAPIALAQRARDAVMADRMLRHKRAVLIAGAGHARLDRGVPRYLRQRAPHAKVLSIGFVEGKQDASGAQHYDFVWITATEPRADPCAGMKMPAPPPASGHGVPK